MKETTAKLPLGSWDSNGIWHHNSLLDMSYDEQYFSNLKNGYFNYEQGHIITGVHPKDDIV